MSEGRPVEEKDFYCSNLSSLQVPVSPFAKSTAKEKESGTSVGALSQLKDTKVPSYAEEEMDEMMHQYLMNGQSTISVKNIALREMFLCLIFGCVFLLTGDVRTIFNGLTFATSNCDKINDDVINIIVQYGG